MWRYLLWSKVIDRPKRRNVWGWVDSERWHIERWRFSSSSLTLKESPLLLLYFFYFFFRIVWCCRMRVHVSERSLRGWDEEEEGEADGGEWCRGARKPLQCIVRLSAHGRGRHRERKPPILVEHYSSAEISPTMAAWHYTVLRYWSFHGSPVHTLSV